MNPRRLHEYPEEYYVSTAEHRVCRQISVIHAIVAWSLVAGLALVLASLVALLAL